jgi:hypothetical protein
MCGRSAFAGLEQIPLGSTHTTSPSPRKRGTRASDGAWRVGRGNPAGYGYFGDPAGHLGARNEASLGAQTAASFCAMALVDITVV